MRQRKSFAKLMSKMGELDAFIATGNMRWIIYVILKIWRVGLTIK